MHKEIDEFEIEFNDALGERWKFFFMSAGKEFQVEACNKLSQLLKKASQIKKQRIAASDEDCANLMLGIESTLETFVSELQMWIALKEDDPNKAWEHLINAQESAWVALRAHKVTNQFSKRFERLNVLEKALFPPQMFVSKRVIAEQVRCSICNEEYGSDKCDHIIGEPYMGRLCHEIIDLKEILGVDFVEHPYTKHARVISATYEGGITRDSMTGRIISDKSVDRISKSNKK